MKIREWKKPRQNMPMKDRIGTVGYNTYGSKMVVEEYNKFSDIIVIFPDTNYRTKTTWDMFIVGKVKNPYDLSVHGVGYIGEGKYNVSVNQKLTHEYNVWNAMLERCYDDKYQTMHSSYIGSAVCKEWHNFQNFAEWFNKNYYKVDDERMNLDKDILVKGNKLYSPETCIFVPQSINKLFTKSDAKRGEFPIGVTKGIRSYINPFIAQCNDGSGKQIKLGYYSTPSEAFLVYKEFKEKIIKNIAEEYKNKIPTKLYTALLKYIVEIID